MATTVQRQVFVPLPLLRAIEQLPESIDVDGTTLRFTGEVTSAPIVLDFSAHRALIECDGHDGWVDLSSASTTRTDMTLRIKGLRPASVEMLLLALRSAMVATTKIMSPDVGDERIRAPYGLRDLLGEARTESVEAAVSETPAGWLAAGIGGAVGVSFVAVATFVACYQRVDDPALLGVLLAAAGAHRSRRSALNSRSGSLRSGRSRHSPRSTSSGPHSASTIEGRGQTSMMMLVWFVGEAAAIGSRRRCRRHARRPRDDDRSGAH